MISFSYNLQPRSGNKHTVMVDIKAKSKRLRFSLGQRYVTTLEKWNPEKGRYRGSDNRNEDLADFAKKANRIIKDFQENSIPFDPVVFKAKWDGLDRTNLTITELIDEHLNRMKASSQIGRINEFKSVRNHLEFFHPEPLSFKLISHKFLRDFETYLLAIPVSAQTLHTYMAVIRRCFTLALEDGIITAAEIPFKTPYNPGGYSYRKHKIRQSSRPLSDQEMEKLKAFPIEKYPEHRFAYDLFWFSYYGGGINFADIAKIKRSDVRDGVCHFQRSKSGTYQSFALAPIHQEIIDRYPGEDYLFPILKSYHRTAQQIHDRLHKIRAQVNKSLKKIGGMLDFEIKFTTYVARHTMSNRLNAQGVSVAQISQILGHTELSTTQKYLKRISHVTPDIISKL